MWGDICSHTVSNKPINRKVNTKASSLTLVSYRYDWHYSNIATAQPTINWKAFSCTKMQTYGKKHPWGFILWGVLKKSILAHTHRHPSPPFSTSIGALLTELLILFDNRRHVFEILLVSQGSCYHWHVGNQCGYGGWYWEMNMIIADKSVRDAGIRGQGNS